MGLLRDLLDADKDGKIVPQLLRLLPWALTAVALSGILVLDLIGYRVASGDGFKLLGFELASSRTVTAASGLAFSGAELRPRIWQFYSESKRTHVVDCVNDATSALRGANFEDAYTPDGIAVYGNVRADNRSLIQAAIRCINLNGLFLMFVSVAGLDDAQVEPKTLAISAQFQKLNVGFDFKRQLGPLAHTDLTHYRSSARFPTRDACMSRSELALQAEQVPIHNRGGDWVSARSAYISLVFWCMASQASQYEPFLYYVSFDRSYADAIGQRLLGNLNR